MVRGLEYPSETDAPFDVVEWGVGGPADAAGQVARRAAGRAVEEVPADRFFAALERTDDAGRFRELRRALDSHLNGLKVFRVGAGQPRVDVYLIGRAAGGAWAGLHPMSVET